MANKQNVKHTQPIDLEISYGCGSCLSWSCGKLVNKCGESLIPAVQKFFHSEWMFKWHQLLLPKGCGDTARGITLLDFTALPTALSHQCMIQNSPGKVPQTPPLPTCTAASSCASNWTCQQVLFRTVDKSLKELALHFIKKRVFIQNLALALVLFQEFHF